jgi:outer membrane protein assembly factor BamB
MPGTDDAGVAATFGHSHVVLLDGSGKVRWTVDHAQVRDVAPRLTADAVLVATEDGLVALDRPTGALRWTASIGERANAPAVAAGVAVVSTWEGSLVGVDIADGSVEWRTPLPGPALGPAAVSGGAAVASWEGDHGNGAGVVAVDAATGRQRWATAVPPDGVSAPAAVAAPGAGGSVVVVAAGDIAAHALSADTGVERWRSDLGGAGSPEDAPLDAGGGAVLVADRLGGMALLDAADGRSRWHVTSDGAAVRGGPAGPGPGGGYALPLEDGRLLLAGPGRPTTLADPAGRVSGVAVGPGDALVVGVREAVDNTLTASTGW